MLQSLLIKDFLTIDSCLSSNAYLTYIGILLSLRKNECEYYIRADCLSYLLSKKYPPLKQIMSAVESGIVELAEKDIILICQSDKKGEWIIDTSLIGMDTTNKFYTMVDETAIRKILLSNTKTYTRSFSLIKFYVYLLSTVFKKKGKDEGVGFTSLSDMSLVWGSNVKTIASYISQLEELELIYVYRPKDSIRFATGEIREISHTYGRYEDKDKIIRFGKNHESEYGMKANGEHKKIQKEKGKASRAMSQKYNHFVSCLVESKAIPYTYEELKEIYEAMVRYNEKYYFRKEKLKDLSVFSEYDFCPKQQIKL